MTDATTFDARVYQTEIEQAGFGERFDMRVALLDRNAVPAATHRRIEDRLRLP